MRDAVRRTWAGTTPHFEVLPIICRPLNSKQVTPTDKIGREAERDDVCGSGSLALPSFAHR